MLISGTVFNDANGNGRRDTGEAGLRDWVDKRNAVNRYFAGLGYEKINVNQKTWCEGPYGRERQGLGPNFENRNKLTTEAVARLLYEITTGRAVTAARSRAMMNLLRRDPSAGPWGSGSPLGAPAGLRVLFEGRVDLYDAPRRGLRPPAERGRVHTGGLHG